jgi:hypothetical protein
MVKQEIKGKQRAEGSRWKIGRIGKFVLPHLPYLPHPSNS